METESIQVSAMIPASPNRIYTAWLDERQHSAFTGGKATIQPWVGGRHTAWDGYIEGTTLELDTGRRIIQSWRTTEFPQGSQDSRLEVNLVPVAGGTEVKILHTVIPAGQGDKYKKGWREYYLTPMKRFFADPQARMGIVRQSAARRPPAQHPSGTTPPPAHPGQLPVGAGARSSVVPTPPKGKPAPAAVAKNKAPAPAKRPAPTKVTARKPAGKPKPKPKSKPARPTKKAKRVR